MNITLDSENLMVRIPQSERAEAWRGRKLTRAGASFSKLDRAEQRERNKLERERQRAKAEKAAERLRHLRENY